MNIQNNPVGNSAGFVWSVPYINLTSSLTWCSGAYIDKQLVRNRETIPNEMFTLKSTRAPTIRLQL